VASPKKPIYQKLPRLARAACLSIVLFLFSAHTVWAQFSDGYNFRKRIEISSSQVSGSQNHNNFPVLVEVTNDDLRSSINGGFVENSNGYDIAFTAADGSTQLNHELQSYNPTTGQVTAWVNVPTLKTQSSTYIYLYYGNSSVSSDPSSPNTWNSNYSLVQHLNNDLFDATSNSNDGTNSETADITGKLIRARDFESNNSDYYSTSSSPSLNITDQITISAWIRPRNTSNPDLVTKGSYQEAYTTFINTNGYLIFNTNGYSGYLTGNSTITQNSWSYVTFTKDGSGRTIYINGNEDASDNNTQAFGTNNNPLNVSGSTYSYDGRIDEVRISTTAHSAGWIQTEYNNQNNPGSFLSIVNDPPELADVENLAKAYNIGSPPITITSNITVDEYDDGTIQSATVQITGNYTANDVLAFSNQNGIAGSWNSSTGTLTLSGSASPADYQAALRSVTFENTSGSPSEVARTIEFQASDGTDNSNIQSREIYIPSIDDLSADVSNVVFHFDGQDVDGDNQTNDQPADGTAVNPWGDRSDAVSGSSDFSFSNGTAAQRSQFFDNSAAMGERGALLYDGTDDSYTRSSENAINTSSFDQKSFALVFRTSDDISSNQVLYEQGAAVRGYLFGIFNGNLYAYTWNNSEWQAGDQNKSINLGPVQPHTSYIVIASHDATAGNLANRTWSANVNGGSIQTLNSADVQESHPGAPEIGASNGARDPVNYNNVNGANFDGYIAELISWNQAFSTTLFSEVHAILKNRWDNTPAQLSAIEGSNVSYTEGDLPKNITSTLSISDPDNTVLDSALVNISSNLVPSEDVLVFSNQNGISGSYDSSTGQLFLSGTSSIGNYQSALRSITYENTNDVNPSTNNRTISFTAYDWDDPSNSQARDITIIPVNTAPSLGNIESTTLNYTEGDGASAITSSITISDEDDNNMEQAIIEVTGNYSQGEDKLAFSDANGITSSWNITAGTLTLSGSATKAEYQSALRSVTYENLSSVPSTDLRTVTFTINDGSNNSNNQNRDISITPTNDAPVLANIESTRLQVQGDDSPKKVTTSITVDDGDDQNIESATIQISNNYISSEDELNFTNILGITGNWNSSTGTLSLTGTASKSDYETALRSVTYDNTNSNPSSQTRTVSFTISDGDKSSNTVSRDIALSAVRSISGLQLWLKGDAGVSTNGSNEVTTWADQSGYSRDFTSASGTRPSFSNNITSLNNQAAIQFTGDGDFLEDSDGNSYINGLSQFTAFYVIQSDQTNTNRGFFDTQTPNTTDDILAIRYDASGANAGAQNLIKVGILGDNPDNQLESFSDIQTTDGQILSLDWQSGEEFNLVVDGVLNNPSAVSQPPSGTINSANTVILGKGPKDAPDTPGQSWDGYIAEVILFDRYLPGAEQESVEDYLSEKYNINIRLIGKATGGENISADTYAGGSSNTAGDYTTLSGPRLREDFRGELTSGNTIVFEAPNGFEWDTGGSNPSVAIQPAYGNSTNLDLSFTSRTADQITFIVNSESNSSSKPGEATFSGLRIRPTQGTLPNTGTITNSGSTGPGGTTNYGDIVMVPGQADSLNYEQPPTNNPVDQAISPAIEVQIVDQFGNNIEQSNTSISASLSSGTGTLSGTSTQQTNVNGRVYFNDLVIDQTGMKKLTVTSSGLPTTESSSFEITDPGALTRFEVEKVGGGIIPPQTAGIPFDIKISAIDGTGSVDTDFDGSVEITSSGTLSEGAGTTASFTNGVLSSRTVTFSNIGEYTITATNADGPENGESNSFTVNPGSADKATSLISANPTYISNDGSATSTITVQLKDSEGNNLQSGGDNVSLSTNAGSLGSITDNNDGTYTATLTSSTNNETATVSGTLDGETITDNANVTFTQFDAIWEGTLGGDPPAEQWSNEDNWSTGTVPQSGDAVLVPEDPATGNRYPVVQNNDQTIKTLVVEEGADVTVGGGQTLTVSGELSGGGNINGSNSANLEVGGNLTIHDLQIGNVLMNGSSLQNIENVNQFNNLEIDNGNNVQVSQNLFVDGTLTLTSGNLIIPSGLNLIANDQSVSSGAITFRRQLSGIPGWRMLSSPVNSTYGDLLDGIITQGYSGAYYDADVAPNDTLQPNVLWYDEDYEGTDNQRWRAPSSASQSLTAARGLFVYVFGDVTNDNRYNQKLPDTLEVTGPENTGTGSEVTFDVSYTNIADSIDVPDTGWNLVGNPFGATLNWDDNPNWTKANINQTIYIWDPNANGGNGSFLTWNGRVGSLGSGLIAPFQGFWVKANSQTPELKAEEEVKTIDGIFRRKETDGQTPPQITFRLETKKNRGINEKAYVMFSPDAKRGYDPRDGYRMFPFGGDFLELAFRNEEGAQMSIEHLPKEFSHRYKLPLEVNSLIDGEAYNGPLTLYWPTMKSLPSDWIIKLRDNKLEKEINLRSNSFYTFDNKTSQAKARAYRNINAEPGKPLVIQDPTTDTHNKSKSKTSEKYSNLYDTRFTLIITTEEIESNIPNKFQLAQNYPNPFNPSTKIEFGLPEKSRVTIEIYDVLGRLVRRLSADEIYPAGFHTLTWSPDRLASGVYLYRVRTEDQAITKKMTYIK